MRVISRMDLPDESDKLDESLNVAGIRSRIIVRRGKAYVPVPVRDVAVFYSMNKISFVLMFSGQKYISDHNLNHLSQMVDSRRFFRVNRQIILNIDAIKEYYCVSYSKIAVELKEINFSGARIMVSQFTAPAFRRWMESL